MRFYSTHMQPSFSDYLLTGKKTERNSIQLGSTRVHPISGSHPVGNFLLTTNQQNELRIGGYLVNLDSTITATMSPHGYEYKKNSGYGSISARITSTDNEFDVLFKSRDDFEQFLLWMVTAQVAEDTYKQHWIYHGDMEKTPVVKLLRQGGSDNVLQQLNTILGQKNTIPT